METSGNRLLESAPSRSLREAIRDARLREAESLDEIADHRSAELARLEVLKAELEKLFEEVPQADDRFDLVLVPSTPARLWIDLFTAVLFDSSKHVYRLIRNSRHGRKMLAETSDVGDMSDRVVDYVAQQVVMRERELDGLVEPRRHLAPDPNPRRPRTRVGLVIWAFLIGLLTGVVGLFAIGYLVTG